MYIEKINGPEDVKKIEVSELPKLAEEMRHALLIRASKHGGHFGPNFGMVEATIALHYVFDSPKDKIVFDVSHQSYPHKMLTGRKDAYLYEDHYDDVSGYTNPHESAHDFFTVGHTSTSVSLACGLAKARDLNGEDGNVIAVIGDGSLSGGEALEGLDYAAELGGNLIIVVNDNDMSIAENHGGIYKNLKLLRETNGQAECNLFCAMGLDYIYVDHGNDVAELIQVFASVKDSKKAVVVHINTLKGKGYAPAEQHKEQWHFNGPFHIETGKPLYEMEEEDYSDVTCNYLMKKMKEDPAVVAITSGTPTVLGFTEDKRKEAGQQFVDVGIAEETAVALAAGIAANGGKPVYGVYSTFVQRTFDQIAQNVCINNSPATIVTFSGSVYGMSDVTHLGLQDIPMMANIPNLVYLAPDLVTTKYHYAKVGKFENSLSLNGWSIPLTNKNFILTFEGEIQLGTDLSKANIEINDSTIHVTVNKPTVISNSIDESSIEVYDETKNIFNPISVSDYKAFAVEQKEKALSEAKKKGLMKTAQKNTEKSIKEIISIIPDTDDYTIEVTFKE